MSKNYEPELGQAIFGQPFKQYECPEYVEAALSHLGREVWRVEHNNGNTERHCRQCRREKTNRWRAENPQLVKELQSRYWHKWYTSQPK